MLTTKKFIKEVEELGFRFLQCTKDIEIYYESNQVAYIFWHWRFYVGTTYKFRDLPKELQEKLFNLLVEYARTPIDEREEPQKYYLMNKWVKNIDNHKCFLNRFLDSYYFLGNITENSSFKTQFTQAEIDEIKERFNTNLDDFEQIRVEEVEDEE